MIIKHHVLWRSVLRDAWVNEGQYWDAEQAAKHQDQLLSTGKVIIVQAAHDVSPKQVEAAVNGD